MAKKHWSVALGVTLIAGVASSLLLRKNRKDMSVRQSLLQGYQGSWWFIDQQHKIQHSLEILPDLNLKTDGRVLANELLEVTADRLVLRDQYGYHLIINCREGTPYDFYDEASDITYVLEKK